MHRGMHVNECDKSAEVAPKGTKKHFLSKTFIDPSVTPDTGDISSVFRSWS